MKTEVETESFYDVLSNADGELLFCIKTRSGSPEHPQILFNGEQHALLYRTAEQMIVLDYITGVCKAIHNKKLNSLIGAKGIVKKVGYLIIVAMSVLLDKTVGDTGAIRSIVIYFFVANEGISILENWSAMGLPLPKKIFEVLEQIKNEKGGGDNE